jgi:2-polyprenyl-3-methyl-5-hydroxy-6-metoxy-1,4-benzoquinol methylase
MNALIRKLSAIRLAPLQIASWGHPITSGLPKIDVFLSGELIENSLTAQTHYRERLVCLPGTGACTLPLEIVAEGFDEQKFGFAVNRQQVNFVIPQMPFKFDPNDDHLLVQIAQQTGPCQFWIFDSKKMPWASNLLFRRMAATFSAHGLDPDAYLKMIPTLSRERFFGLLDVMDVYLDCPNFSGYTTAWQAAKRGIPIVTLEGEFMRQRLAAGLLRKMGVTDTIASNAKEYVAIAISLGQESRDPLSRSTRRARVCDAARAADEDVRVVRAFEKTLIEELAKQGVHIDNDNRPPAVQATQINQKMLPENPPLTKAPAPEPVVYPWQLLSSGLHLQTLKPDYAPVGLLEMITTPTRPATSGNPSLRVLDVGCFCGGSGRWLLKKFPGADIIGIEMLEKAAALAASDYHRVIVNTFENVDFESEGLAPGSFDAIIAADVLEHLYNPWAALQRLKPLLAPGGSIYVSLPNIRNLNILLGLAKGEWHYAGAGILDISHIRFFTRRQAIEMLEQTGWSVAEVRINPDGRLTPVFAGKDLSQIQNIDAGHLKLEKLEKEDLLELMALQFFIRATPATDKGAQ